MSMLTVRERRKLETRQALLDAAADVIAEQGVEGARLDDIATRAGYTQGAIYHQFGSKSGLIAALLESMTIAPAGDIDDLDVLGPAVAEAIKDHLSTHIGLLFQVYAYALREPELLTWVAG